MSQLLLKLISFYQIFLSLDTGLLRVLVPGGACKFSPSCSEYTKQMIIKHGSSQGLGLGIRRFAVCR